MSAPLGLSDVTTKQWHVCHRRGFGLLRGNHRTNMSSHRLGASVRQKASTIKSTNDIILPMTSSEPGMSAQDANAAASSSGPPFSPPRAPWARLALSGGAAAALILAVAAAAGRMRAASLEAWAAPGTATCPTTAKGWAAAGQFTHQAHGASRPFASRPRTGASSVAAAAATATATTPTPAAAVAVSAAHQRRSLQYKLAYVNYKLLQVRA